MDDDEIDPRAFDDLSAAASRCARDLRQFATHAVVLSMELREFVDGKRHQDTPARQIAEAVIARARK